MSKRVPWVGVAIVAIAASGCAQELDPGGVLGDDASATAGGGKLASGSGGGAVGGGGGGGHGGDIGFGGSGGSVPEQGTVYTHNQTTLYELDPIAKTLTVVGDFDCVFVWSPGDTFGGMMDIAIDKDGAMYGVGTTKEAPDQISLLEVDPSSAKCTTVGAVTIGEPRGLTFVPVGVLDAQEEVLVAQTENAFYRVDRATGSTTLQSSLHEDGIEWLTKGSDVVSILNDASYTVAYADSGQQFLLEIDLATGEVVKIVAALGSTDDLILGTGYWGGLLYAFSEFGQLLEIDPLTKEVTALPVSAPPYGFRGAAVTTTAPIVIPK